VESIPESAGVEFENSDATVAEEASRLFLLDETGIEILRATRTWIQYGAFGFAVLCIVVGAVEALFGR
jgi:hypothetical protein